MRKYILLAIVVVLGVVLDQVTKHWANRNLFTPDHPAVVAGTDHNPAKSLEEVLKERFPQWSDGERAAAIKSQTVALKKADAINPEYQAPERARLFIFVQRDLTLPPRKVVESTHTFLIHWLTQILEMPYREARQQVDEHLTRRSYLELVAEQLVALSEAEIKELLASYTYRQDHTQPIRSDTAVSDGNLFIVQVNHQAIIIPNFFYLSYVENPGAAWGFLAGAEASFRRTFFMSITALAIVFIMVIFVRLSQRQLLLTMAFSLILSGALGNFIDRFRFNYVIDFIDFRWYDVFRWPTFNIADILISAGVALLFINLIRTRGAHLSEQ